MECQASRAVVRAYNPGGTTNPAEQGVAAPDRNISEPVREPQGKLGETETAIHCNLGARVPDLRMEAGASKLAERHMENNLREDERKGGTDH